MRTARYISASTRATVMAKGVMIWAEVQDAKGIMEKDAANRLWRQFVETYDYLNEADIEHIKKVQYDLMTWAIHN